MELKPGWSRRDFVKASVAAAAASVVGIPVPAWAMKESGWRWDKAVCRFCGVGCGLRIASEGGKVVAVQGDRHNQVNRGLLCAKGYANAQILYGEDRLTQPLLRMNRTK